MFRFVALLCIVLACPQCQENCALPFDKAVVVKFLDYNNKKELPDSVVFSTVVGKGSGYISDTTVRAKDLIRLRLNPSADSVTYEFKRKKTLKTYTATLYYKRTPEIRNPDCGVVMQYANLRAGKSILIDSVAIGNTTIDENNTSKPHIVFYIKP